MWLVYTTGLLMRSHMRTGETLVIIARELTADVWRFLNESPFYYCMGED